MKSVTKFKIRELSIDGLCWRVDWIGAVSYIERYRRSSQPLIEVQFSLVVEEQCDELTLFNFQPEERPLTKTIRFPVGLLPMFKLGDFWRHGSVVRSPMYDTARFNNVVVGPRNGSLIKAGLPHDEASNFYLPLAVHPYHARHTQSYCVHVETEMGHLIIPATELLRFYFGSSSALVAKLFDAPLKAETLWLGIEESDSRGTPKIHLAPGLSGRSASDIGRIALSKEAWTAAELVGNSCIAATANREQAYVKTMFPFQGSTDLTASGKWLPLHENMQGVFLVFKLLSCSYPFPFASLRYTSEQASGPNRTVHSEKNRTAEPPAKRFVKQSVVEQSIVDVEPGRAKVTTRLNLFQEETQFPDLIRKPVRKIEPDQAPTVLIAKEGISIFSGVAVGENGRDSHIKPLDLVRTSEPSSHSASRKGTPLFAEVFSAITRQLQNSLQFASVNVVRLEPRQKSDVQSSMPQIVDTDGQVASVCLQSIPNPLDGTIGSMRLRRLSIGCVVRLHDSIFFLLPEPRAGATSIEFHLIADSAKTIRATTDLIAAIAVHFSDTPSFGKTRQLNENTSSIAFLTEASGSSANEIATNLLFDSRHVFNLSLIEARENGSDTLLTCPEYLH